jgi:hypothetical protein
MLLYCLDASSSHSPSSIWSSIWPSFATVHVSLHEFDFDFDRSLDPSPSFYLSCPYLSIYLSISLSLSLFLSVPLPLSHRFFVFPCLSHSLKPLISTLPLSSLYHLQDWCNKCFSVLNHHDLPGLFILGPLDDVSSLLEDSRVALQVMRTSAFLEDIQVTHNM